MNFKKRIIIVLEHKFTSKLNSNQHNKLKEKFEGGEKNESDIQNGTIYKRKKGKQMQQEEKYLQN